MKQGAIFICAQTSDCIGGTIRFALELAKTTGLPLVRTGNRFASGLRLLDERDVETIPWEESQNLYDLERSICVHFSPGRDYELQRYFQSGMRVVVHDMRAFEWIPGLKSMLPSGRTLVIRERMLQNIPDATFLHHPYSQVIETCTPLYMRPHLAVCHARIDFSKRTHLIIESGIDCLIRGKANRAYVKWKLKNPLYYDVPHDRPAPRLAMLGKFNVDMSKQPGIDGSGSQYTWLEAMDAGAIPVTHKDWGPVEFAAVQTESPEELQALAHIPDSELYVMQIQNFEYLDRRHSGQEWRTLLGV